MEKALEIAAQCWCDLETKNIVMNSSIAKAFAKRLAEKMEIIHNLEQKLAERETIKGNTNIEVGDWVSFYRAVAPSSNVTNAIIARVISISECNYVKGSMIINTDQGPVGEKHILQVRKN